MIVGKKTLNHSPLTDLGTSVLSWNAQSTGTIEDPVDIPEMTSLSLSLILHN